MPRRISILILSALLCPPFLGCQLTHNALLTTVIEPAQYPRNVYEKTSRHRFRKFAAGALATARAEARANADNYDCEPFTPDHEEGFLDGYVDFLEAGGNGQPPVLPPRRYWKAKYQTTFGQQCVQDWFRGYSHGVAAAQASNHRSLVTVAVSDAIASTTTPYAYGRILPASQLPVGSDDEEGDENADGDLRYAQLPETDKYLQAGEGSTDGMESAASEPSDQRVTQ